MNKLLVSSWIHVASQTTFFAWKRSFKSFEKRANVKFAKQLHLTRFAKGNVQSINTEPTSCYGRCSSVFEWRVWTSVVMWLIFFFHFQIKSIHVQQNSCAEQIESGGEDVKRRRRLYFYVIADDATSNCIRHIALDNKMCTFIEFSNSKRILFFFGKFIHFKLIEIYNFCCNYFFSTNYLWVWLDNELNDIFRFFIRCALRLLYRDHPSFFAYSS